MISRLITFINSDRGGLIPIFQELYQCFYSLRTSLNFYYHFIYSPGLTTLNFNAVDVVLDTIFQVQPWLQWLREADEESDDEKENHEEAPELEEKTEAESVGAEKAEVLVVENIAQLEVN